MGDIIIANAPVKYRQYLSAGDAHDGAKGHDGRLDTDEEAKCAADQYCKDHFCDCEEFLKYLDRSGYSHLQLVNNYEKKKGAEIDDLLREFPRAFSPLNTGPTMTT